MKRPELKVHLSALALAVVIWPAYADQPAPHSGNTDWVLDQIDGQSVRYFATVNLAEPGKIAGLAPCNRFSGAARIDGAALVIGAIAATKMACPDLAGEAEYFQTLQVMTAIEVTSVQLRLTGAGHDMVFRVTE